MSIALDQFCLDSQWYFPLWWQLTLVLVGLGGPFLIQQYICMLPFGSFQIILPILLQWLMPWCISWYLIPHVMANFWDRWCYWCVVALFCDEKNIHLICCVPLVLICRMHMNIDHPASPIACYRVCMCHTAIQELCYFFSISLVGNIHMY